MKMQMTFRAGMLLSALVATLIPPTADAGVKYWDNPGFRTYDVGDYVQDGLIVNYDGIRNAGPNAGHDSNATTWVNCANPGTYDQTRYSLNVAPGVTNWVAGAAKGSWTDNGFVFNTNALFHQGTSFTVPATYTMQTLVDAKASTQTSLEPGKSTGGSIGYVMCDRGASNWSKCSIGIRRDNYNYNGTKYQYSFYLVTASDGTARPAFGNSKDVTFDYATAIANGSSGSVFFNGTEAPWSASGAQNGRSTTAVSAVTFGSGFSIGGHYPNVKEYFSGTVKNFRIYNRCLNDAEVLWNRVVDEARYFGRSCAITVIPATNVVESTTIPGVRDYHYALDSDGFTFTAPAQKTVDGKRYILGGYTLETWNGTAWGAPVSHDDESSYTATDTSALVRLTWQYTAASGEGKLAVYGVGDYVQEGLLVHYDGICNVGTNTVHDYTTTKWVNLGTGGESYDLARAQKVVGDQGRWLDNGYRFAGNSVFSSARHNGNWLTYTFQWVIDGKKSEQKYNPPYLFSASWNNFAFGMGDNPKNGCFHYNTQGAGNRPYILNSAKEYAYGTAISDGENKEIKFFEGISAPTSGGVANGYYKFADDATMSALSYSQGSYNVGGYGSADGQFVGEMKNIRIYTKVLSDAEIAHNRRVDNYRYFGIYEPETTNVVVCSTYSYLEGYDKCGAYEVDGSYTFTAPASVTAANGITYACDGYTIETMDASGNWGAAVSNNANAYRATGSGTVRLTWRWKATHGLRSAADYDVTDYVAAGLKVHLDGICNAGADKPRTTANTAGTKWVNLGSNGTGSNASLTKGSDNSAWTDDGYYFDGKSKFVIANAGVKANSSYTIQFLSDVDRSLQRLDGSGNSQHNYLFSGSYNKLAVSIYGQGKAYLRAGTDLGFSLATGEHLTYFTGMMDQSGASPVAYVFPGVTTVSGTTSTSSSLTTPTVNSPAIGGWGGDNLSQYLIGTVKNFRYYDRVLTEEELVRNRNVDSARYFNALAVTNVFVVAGGTGAVQTETGAYKVEGAWTFTASKTVDKKGTVVDVVRYSTEELVDGEWKNKTYHNGSSYTYTEGTDPATVRLKWLGQPLGTVLLLQ